MPTYDRACEGCGYSAIDVWEPVNYPAPACPDCGGPTVRAWLTKAAAIVPDSMFHWQQNGLRHPRLFESKQEHRRWLKETGQEIRSRHLGIDGTDKSPHTSRWVSMDAQTLENARILLERTAQDPTRNEPQETPLTARLTTGDLNSPEFEAWRHGR